MRVLTAILLALAAAAPCSAARIQDLVHIQGAQEVPLVGYGLVVGLPGSGDRYDPSTEQSISNMLGHFGIGVAARQLRSRNVASVLVTATLTPFPQPGRRLDAMVASVGDAASLEGGVLLRTQLNGPDGSVMAEAQGPLSAAGRRSVTGRIPSGLRVLVASEPSFIKDGELRLTLDQGDFQTAQRIALAISKQFGPSLALAQDAGTVRVKLPSEFKDDPVAFVAQMGAVDVTPNEVAKVVVDERTGAVVIGGQARLLPAAIGVGAFQIEVTAPSPEKGPGLKGVEASSLHDLIQALNALGASPQQMVEVLKAMHSAGVLVGDLEVL